MGGVSSVEDGAKRTRAPRTSRGRKQGDKWVKDGVEVLGSMPGRARVQRRPGEKLVVLFTRVREDDKAALRAWVEELRGADGVWAGLSESDLVRDIIQAALKARRAGV